MNRKTNSKILLFLIIFALTHAQLVNITNNTNTTSTPNQPLKQVVMLATIQNVTDLLSPAKILKSLGVPGFASKNGYNHVVLEGWSCQADRGLPLKIWQEPNMYLNNSIGNTDEATRATLKIMFKAVQVKLMANVFSDLQNPISNNLNASQCALRLGQFLLAYDLDGANIDLKDEKAINAQLTLPWLNEFFLQLQNYKNLTFSLSLNVSLFNLTNYPSIRLHLLEKTVASTIKFYVFRYYDQKYGFTNYKDIFQGGDLSVHQLVNEGFPINKIVVGKPSLYNQTGFVPGNQLIQWFKNANIAMSWRGGLAVSPFVQSEAADYLREVVKRRDILQPVIATNLDRINFWWPPQKTLGDMGVPSFAPNNRYNYFNLGVWSCKNGDYDVARLWSNPTYFLSNKFGSTRALIQGFLKSKYQSAKKKIFITAFGNAQSPTTSKQDPVICGKSLAAYVINNNLDGVEVKYMDNTAFNQGFAEQWLITFSITLRNLLPFHIISHSIQNFYLHNTRYAKGGYQKVILQIGNTLDFYSIIYYGDQRTNFDTFEQLFLNSGSQIPQSSVTELVNRGFELNKIVIAKPIRLYDAQGAGFVNTTTLRSIFLRASNQLNWRGGIHYSSYINDQSGAKLLDLIRGINRTDTIRFAYVNNVDMWWPPKSTLGQMGVPVLSSPNMYNYFAYSFWTYNQGPLAITKLYNDPIKYLGSDLGHNKIEIQSYMFDFYRKTNTKLLVSTFGDRQFPVKAGIDPIDCADKLVQYTLDNQIDGLDIDFEDSQSFIDGTGQNWLAIFMRQLRSALPFHIISHAPQAPYFSPLFAPTGSYLKVHKQVGKFIDFYNIQFYNQGQNTKYDTYESLFINSGKSNPNTSIFQIIAQGIEPQKIVLGKPVTKTDSYNTGFVQANTLNSLLRRVKTDRNNPGWNPSVMFWHFLSDVRGEVVAQVLREL